MTSRAPFPPEPDGEKEQRFKELVREYETRLIRDALLRAGGNKTEAARLLKMPLRTLANKIRAYGLVGGPDD
jgi:DNA-binding NtrC family response regulator